MEFVKAVIQFNSEILDIQQRSFQALGATEFTHAVKCLEEEVDEFIAEGLAKNTIGQVDAMVDLMYFAIGIMYKMGLTPGQIHDCCMAVHHANMTKKRGVVAKRATGAPDATKPEGWVPPEEAIRAIIYGDTNG